MEALQQITRMIFEAPDEKTEYSVARICANSHEQHVQW
jgi:hypothetical protein